MLEPMATHAWVDRVESKLLHGVKVGAGKSVPSVADTDEAATAVMLS